MQLFISFIPRHRVKTRRKNIVRNSGCGRVCHHKLLNNCRPPPQNAWVCTIHFHSQSQQTHSLSMLGYRNVVRMHQLASVACFFLPLWCPDSSPAFLTVLLIDQHFPFLVLFFQQFLYCSPKILCIFLFRIPTFFWCLKFHGIFFSVHSWGFEFVRLVFSFHYSLSRRMTFAAKAASYRKNNWQIKDIWHE